MSDDLKKYRKIVTELKLGKPKQPVSTHQPMVSPFVKNKFRALVSQCRNHYKNGTNDPLLDQEVSQFLATHGNEIISTLAESKNNDCRRI